MEEDEELEQFMEKMREVWKHETLEEMTCGFICYPIWWNDAVCFLKSQMLCIPGVLLDADECEFYSYAKSLKEKSWSRLRS